MSESARDIIAMAALVVLAMLLHAGILDSSWRWDDPQILLHLQSFPLSADFTDPQVWQLYSPANLTPWLILSFELDAILFGLTPAAFYAHQLLALAGAGAALFLCLRLWLQRRVALAAALLFLLGAPVAILLEQLMTRHYIEGLLFCLLALYCFVRFLRGASAWMLVAGVFFYALSLTAKEIYAPLLLLLPFLPEGKLRQRLLGAIPFAVVALAYTVWRAWMLGSLGGYVAGSDYMNLDVPLAAVAAFSRFPALLFGPVWPVLVLVYAGLFAACVWLARARVLLSLLLLALVLLPLVPLVRTPGINSPDRYLFLFWVVLVASLAFYSADILSALRSPRTRAAVWFVMPLFAVGAALQAFAVGRSVETVGEEFDLHARFILENEAAAFMPSAHVLSSFWFVTGLSELKQRVTGVAAPVAIVDPIYLDGAYLDGTYLTGGENLFVFERECLCMRDASDSLPQLLQQHRESLRPQAPLRLSYAYQDGWFSWEFGPYTEGSWTVVSEVIGVVPAPAEGRLRVTLQDNAPFYLRYTAPEGWSTYSTVQKIQHNAPLAAWQRGLP